MLDQNSVQIILADLQDSIIGASRTCPPEDIRRAVTTITGVARVLGLPVTVSAAPRPGGPGVIEEIPKDAPLFVRTGPSCWDDEAGRAAIENHGRPVLALCGVTSEIVILRTALDALAAGYQVQVLVDACGGLGERGESAAFRQIEAAGGVVTSVPGFVADMVRDFTTPQGREVIAALHGQTA
ncbi:isochorismatase family protein [Nonomuraea sp. NBC_01738]|uniref:isochorismatase family protein n=1 Tax=Nonomuraea sp. NBC_01738 TaxID=2976003 RepID=UPI002E14C593|nr:isochorismatase family protein [Nonomuraea sp. NBC_01738]